MLQYSNRRVSLALSPSIFSIEFIDNSIVRVFEMKRIPIIPLAGVGTNLFEEAKEIGLGGNNKKLEKIVTMNSNEVPVFSKKEVETALKTKKIISVQVGPNNVHDILDSLDENH